jgi:hypothetical protein
MYTKIGCILFAASVLVFSLLPAGDADAAFFVEGGEGFYYSHNTEVVMVRYQLEASALFNEESFYEVSYAAWNGLNRNQALGLARGIRFERTADGSVSITMGLCRIHGTSMNLGQPYEFYGRLAFEKQLGTTLVSIGWIHYSDAKFLFHWPGPNNGENFLTLSLGAFF